MELKRVVITGLGAITPIGNTVTSFWENLVNGVNGAGPITHFDATNFKTQFACEVKGFDPTQYLDKKEARKLDTFVQYAMASTQDAISDANIDISSINLDRAGVIWGSGIGGLETISGELKSYYCDNRGPRFNPFFVPKMIIDIAAGHISIKYGFRGPNFATVSACASSTNAIADAYNYIRLGKANIIITGGSEACITEAGVGGFNAMHAISTRNDSPQTASRPFDKDRDGFVMGDGSGTLILEEYEHAKKRGAKIYAELVGAALTADAHHITAPHPEGHGAIKVMEFAIEDAGMKPEDIDYVNAHGTSTSLNDMAEVNAILKVFGNHAYNLNISSTKSMTGHLLGAAGAVESIACVLAIKNDIVPPTINHFELDPLIDGRLNFTFNKAQKRVIRAALNSNFGFGGHNVSLVFKKFTE